MSDFANLISIADELDSRCAIVRVNHPDKVFEVDAIAAKASEFRAFAEKLSNETIKTASTDDLMAVHNLMGETMGLIKMISGPTTVTRQ